MADPVSVGVVIQGIAGLLGIGGRSSFTTNRGVRSEDSRLANAARFESGIASGFAPAPSSPRGEPKPVSDREFETMGQVRRIENLFELIGIVESAESEFVRTMPRPPPVRGAPTRSPVPQEVPPARREELPKAPAPFPLPSPPDASDVKFPVDTQPKVPGPFGRPGRLEPIDLEKLPKRRKLETQTGPRVKPAPSEIGPPVIFREIGLPPGVKRLPQPAPTRVPAPAPAPTPAPRPGLPTPQQVVGLILGGFQSIARARSRVTNQPRRNVPSVSPRPPIVAQPVSPTFIQPVIQTTATKTKTDNCEKRARKNRKTCWRGFYEEFGSSKTKFTKWEKVDCVTRRRLPGQ